MDILRAYKNAVRSLRRHRIQSALSLLGIVIGVFSVTLIVSLGLGLRAFLVAEIETFGTNLMAVNPSVPSLSGQGSLTDTISGMFVTTLKLDDMEALKDKKVFPYITTVTGIKSGQDYVHYRNKEMQAMLMGSSYTYPDLDSQAKVEFGRFYNEKEEKSMAKVVVLGSAVAERLFGDRNGVGEKVRINNVPLEVIGVLADRGTMAGFDYDTIVFIPVILAARQVIGLDFLNEIDIKITDESMTAVAEEEITRMLRKRHGITDPSKDDFIVTTMTEVMDQINTITGAITLLLGFLAAISLFVGGIGIMNIMLVSVAERIREVGLRKSLGAKNEDIKLQFLTEAVILTTSGGLVGGMLGFLSTIGAVATARHLGYAIPYMVSLPAFVVAAFVSAGIGIVFGLYPAGKAAKLDPITALRFQ